MPDLAVIEPEGVSPDLIETIEAVLELSRKGEVSSVAIALVFRDGSTRTSWSSPPMWAALCGAVAHLAWRMSFNKQTAEE